jgi:hypothetical protein
MSSFFHNAASRTVLGRSRVSYMGVTDRDSSVCTVGTLRGGCSGVRFPAEVKHFLLFSRFTPSSGFTHPRIE